MAYEINKTKFHIDSGVALSNRSGRKSKIMELPFDQLKVGDSFHVNGDVKQLSAWCQLAGKKLEKRFSLRTVDERDPRGPGIRIWRVEDKAHTLDSLFAGQDKAPAKSQSQPQKVSASKPTRARTKATKVEPEPRSFNRRQRKAAAEAHA